MKVIYLAFANSPSKPLNHLTEEFNALTEILNDRYIIGDYLIVPDPYATPRSIARNLAKYKDSLTVFHYSGHAGKDRLLAGDEPAFIEGISAQLKNSSENGVLKLVVLNGCSTGGQVDSLLKMGVPAVVSTTTSVSDKAATDFSIQFWTGLVSEEKTIENAFYDALPSAAIVAKLDLSHALSRHIITESIISQDLPLWSLDPQDGEGIKINPIPYKQNWNTGARPQAPNLIDTLYRSFNVAGNPRIRELVEKEGRQNPQDHVTTNDKETAILNSIPHPIGIHLQKLFCLKKVRDRQQGNADENLLLLINQIAQFFQITMEFFGIIMIAQVWELRLRSGDQLLLGDELKERLRDYISMSDKERESYDYISLIALTRKFINEQGEQNADFKSFIDEQEFIKDLFVDDEDFGNACRYLTNLKLRITKNKLNKSLLPVTCQEAEQQLCDFVRPLGFIHRYQLSSIKHIDVMKFRHTNKVNAEYKHKIIPCMQANETDDYNYYCMKSFLDNWGVVLIKSELQLIDGKRKIYAATIKDFLNLSPFVIDRNSFIKNSNLCYIMFFKGLSGSNESKKICFKKVQTPTEARDGLEINMVMGDEISDDDDFHPIRLQFAAFQEVIS